LKVFGVNDCTASGCSEAGLNWFEHYYINLVTGDRSKGVRQSIKNAQTGENVFRKPFDYVGTKSFPHYETYARSFIYDISIPNCGFNGRVFVGQRQDGFNINLGQIFDLINFIPIPGLANLSITESDANNDLSVKAITSIALEVHSSCLLAGSVSNGVLSSWVATRRLLHIGDEHIPGKQVSRLANPLVNELLIGIDQKGYWNRRHVRYDADFFDFIAYPTMPEVINILFKDAVNTIIFKDSPLSNLAPQVFPRTDLLEIFYTGIPGLNSPANVLSCDQLRLNTSIPAVSAANQKNMGVLANDLAGFPNGRRPGDDIVDIALRALVGVLLVPSGAPLGTGPAPIGLVELTDGAPVDASYFDEVFPYLRTPIPGSA